MALIVGTKIGEHDPCFAAVRDAEILRIYEEERFNRVKHGVSCAATGFRELLEDCGIGLEEVDYFTNYLVPERTELRKAQLESFLGPERSDKAAAMFGRVHYAVHRFRDLMAAIGIPADKTIDVRHHLAHCAGVFYPSPCAEAAILSVDGGGEAETALLAHGRGEDIDVLAEVPHPHSLGHFYLAATRWLGWDYGEEGKTMALAGYGKPRFYELFRENYVRIGGSDLFRLASPLLPGEAFEALLGPGRQTGDELDQRHKDVAATVQRITTEALIAMAGELKRLTGSRRLLVTGGVGLNSAANGEILRTGLFESVQAYPQANDTGTAVGGAMYVEYAMLGRKRRSHWVMRHAYWGREIDEDSVEREAAAMGLAARRSNEVAREAARMLADGKIVGWVQGRSEIGPRALGNRSILCDPRDPAMRDKVNLKVKNREPWRPFAPSVLEEDADRYFCARQALPYMIINDQVRPEWRERLPAVLHVDGTARVQAVSAKTNPRFHALIRAFKELTGLGVVLNTSFNDRGEPLVQTARQAMIDYLRSDMDCLVIGAWIIDDKPAAAKPSRFHPVHESLDQLPDGTRTAVLHLFGAEHLATFKPMLEGLAERGLDFTLVAGPYEDCRRQVGEGNWSRTGLSPQAVAPFETLEAVRALGPDYVILPVPFNGCDLVFRKGELYSEPVELVRELHKRFGLPAFAIDRLGGLTDLRLVFAVRDRLEEWKSDRQRPGFLRRVARRLGAR